ncbi:hypothetical protein [Agromyces sp. ZXT2-6]|uniref:hypothetical protein n=1 Tax=Agromyces sp. ZXT2-6 TaxID=3461153 RepID=UPI004054E6D8
MNDDEQRDPLERLRAADPAAGVEPRDGFADEVVARATDDSATDAAPVTDLGAERERRRPAWIPAAAAAAAIVVVGAVGAVGYGIGSTTGGAVNLADGAAPPISLESGADAGMAEQGMMPEPSTDDLTMSAPDRTGMIWPPYGGGRNSFSASGLSTEDGTAAAYGFDARAASTADTVADLAAALGVEGTPQLVDGSWTVGPQDGTGPTLGVSLDGTLGFWYSDPRLNPWECEVEPDSGAEACEPSGDLPSEQAAVDALRSLLASTGRDPGGYEFTSETWEGAVTRPAQGWPVVDGQRVDQAWSIELADEGMVSASGALAELVELGEYPVVSEQEAFERLSDPRFGAQMTIMPAAVRDEAVTTEEWVPPTEPPAAPSPGTSVSWPVNDVEIVEARLGLASQWQPDGSVLVVPAYEFTDADGGTWSVIAVADSKLDFSTE